MRARALDIAFCAQCSVYIPRERWARMFCIPCAAQRYLRNGRIKAGQLLHREILAGRIPRPDTMACTDCGAHATQYDHRDYSKPFDVEPVCGSCNMRREPAKWVRYESRPSQVAA